MYSWTTADTVNTNSMAAALKRFWDIWSYNKKTQSRHVKTSATLGKT